MDREVALAEALESVRSMAGNGVLCEPFSPVGETKQCVHCKRIWADVDEALAHHYKASGRSSNYFDRMRERLR